MRNKYHTLHEDTALFDRLRRRAYYYTSEPWHKIRIVSVFIRPAYLTNCGIRHYYQECRALTSADITYWRVTVVYDCGLRVSRDVTREEMEKMYRNTNRRTKYYNGGVE